MSATRLVEIGLTLGDLYKTAAGQRHQDWQCSQGNERRKVELTPAEGWPGKNDKERKAAEERAYLDDEILQKGLHILVDIKVKLAQLEGEISALEAERRALEWGVRSQMVSALAQAHVDANGRGDAAERAFDDVGQAELDAQASLGTAAWDEIPF